MCSDRGFSTRFQLVVPIPDKFSAGETSPHLGYTSQCQRPQDNIVTRISADLASANNLKNAEQGLTWQHPADR